MALEATRRAAGSTWMRPDCDCLMSPVCYWGLPEWWIPATRRPEGGGVAQPNARDEASREAIAARLATAGFALPGSLLERTMRCAKPNCACKTEPPKLHGPYHQWTR